MRIWLQHDLPWYEGQYNTISPDGYITTTPSPDAYIKQHDLHSA